MTQIYTSCFTEKIRYIKQIDGYWSMVNFAFVPRQKFRKLISFDRSGRPAKPRSTMPLLRHNHAATYTVTLCLAAATQKQIQLPFSQRTVT